VAIAAATATLACESGHAPAETRAPAPAAPAPSGRPGGPTFIRGPTDGKPIEPFVAARLKAAPEGRDVLVYVGAPWCEPCQRFHEAVVSGRLDTDLPGVELVEFDLDVDRDPLTEAGCASRLIPLFAVPEASGRCSGRRIFGSVKGDRAVDDNLVPRLTKLLAGLAVE
jgi:hypothetical protein